MSLSFKQLIDLYPDSTPKKFRLDDIIAEQKISDKLSDINILILSSKEKEDGDKDDSPKWTVNRIQDYCKKNEIPNYVAYMSSAILLKEDGKVTIRNVEDKEGFTLNPDKTIAIIRGGAKITLSHMMMDVVSQLERYSIFCLNSSGCIYTCGDKYKTYLKLTDSGLLCPKSALINSVEEIEPAFEKIGGKFPIVVKLLSGSKGIGVFIIESHKSLKSVLQVMWKVCDNSELLVQEYIESDFDVRAHVLGDKVIAAMKRYTITDDFRSNYSLGSKIEEIGLDDEVKEACIKASKACGGIWTGVDFKLIDKKPYFLEINSSPGTYGIEKSTKKDVVSKVIEYVKNKDNWVKSPQTCGFLEIIEIEGFGELVAKLDTGNGATCAIHSENIEINKDKKTVSWKSGDKEFTKPYVRKIIVRKGGVGGIEAKRITVLMELRFNGSVYKDVEFALDDRSGKTSPVLLNRQFMSVANIIVNPTNAFLLTINPFENKEKGEEIKMKAQTPEDFRRSDFEVVEDKTDNP